MSGYALLNLCNGIAALALAITLNWLLIPQYGGLGAAAGTARRNWVSSPRDRSWKGVRSHTSRRYISGLSHAGTPSGCTYRQASCFQGST